jgi:hydrogenase expression/formation protein HypE
MEIGKVPSDILQSILSALNPIDQEDVLMGAGMGQDCGILDYGEWACSVSSDPITGTGSRQGYLGVHVACNDIAASGAKPMGVTLTLLMPNKSSERDIKEIMDDAVKAAKEINVAIIGGHTEITDAVNRPVVTVTAIGKMKKADVMHPKNINAGDKLVLTKQAGVEGCAILAQECREYLLKQLHEDTIESAASMLKSISVYKESCIAMENQVTYMHDVTEGGVLGAVWEVAEAAQKGVKIDASKILVSTETLSICNILEIEPLKLISSGSMLIVVKPKHAEALIAALEIDGISASIIGEITDEQEKNCFNADVKTKIHAPESDHLFKGLKKARQT